MEISRDVSKPHAAGMVPPSASSLRIHGKLPTLARRSDETAAADDVGMCIQGIYSNISQLRHIADFRNFLMHLRAPRCKPLLRFGPSGDSPTCGRYPSSYPANL